MFEVSEQEFWEFLESFGKDIEVRISYMFVETASFFCDNKRVGAIITRTQDDEQIITYFVKKDEKKEDAKCAE